MVRQSQRPARTQTKHVVNYAESSSDSSSDAFTSSENEVESAGPARRNTRRNLKSQVRNSSTQSLSSKARPTSRKRQYPTSGVSPSPKKPKRQPQTFTRPSEHTSMIIESGIIPPWHTLPYEILLQIFRFASYPLYDEQTFESLPSSRWLLDMATVCKDFTEPALTTLYTSPPLVPMVQAHRLVDLLAADPRSMTFKYRQKVESVQIEVSQVAAYSLPGSGLLDLHSLIKTLPRLTGLEFYHQKDMSPFRSLEQNIKWSYPENLFSALEHTEPGADPGQGDKTSVCHLRSWRWSSRLAGKNWSIEKIPGLHSKPFFASLRKVAFVNYQVPVLKKEQADPKHEELIAKALENLKHLEHLTVESSTLMNHKLLPMLPKHLRHLELINCWEVTADDFSTFLLTHGSQLRCLTLHHNQSLSLSFLPVLGSACPNLEILRMNMTYYHIHPTYRNSEPLYEDLLLADEVPTWPSALQIIELSQLRKWHTDAAETFFDSLLNSAEQLPDLRKLSLQVILNIGWRDRASFRDKWVGSLMRTFKRVSKPPNVHTTVRPPMINQGPAAANAKSGGDKSPRTKTLRPCSTSTSPETGTSRVRQVNSKYVDLPSRHHRRDHRGETSTAESARLTRPSTRQQLKGRYAESDDDAQASSMPTMQSSPSKFAARELKRLQDSVGYHGSFVTPPETPEETGATSGEDPATMKGKRKAKAVIQGMCDIVEIRIDNLRPAETQVTEADFLDEEQSGDEDWDENGDGEVDDGYAW